MQDKNSSKNFSNESHSEENESFNPTSSFYSFKNLYLYFTLLNYTLPITIPYLNTLSSARFQNQKVVGSQSETSTKNPKLRQQIRIKYDVTQKHPRVLG